MLLSDERIEALKRFSNKIEIKFKDLELLNMALCHTSYAYEQKLDRNESYERLEFLGDAVLKLVASDILYNEFQNKTEGQMSEQRSTIVSDKTIAVFAEKINLSDLILTGKCEKEGGNKKESILACAFEALLGAIYLEYKDEGYIKAKDFLVKNFKDEILKKDYINPKASLQEFTQKYNHNLPEYVLMKEFGPAHNKTFVVGVYYENKFIDKGEASTKKEAEFIAADKALIKLKEIYKDV